VRPISANRKPIYPADTSLHYPSALDNHRGVSRCRQRLQARYPPAPESTQRQFSTREVVVGAPAFPCVDADPAASTADIGPNGQPRSIRHRHLRCGLDRGGFELRPLWGQHVRPFCRFGADCALPHGLGRYENSHFDPKYGEGELRSLLSGTVGSRVVALPYLEIKTPYSRARMPYPGSIYWTWNEGQN
jgi:hypothetical protein